MHPSLAGLRSRAPLVVLSTLVTVGVALVAASSREPRYEGRAEIVIDPSILAAVDARWIVPTEIRLLTSQEVRARAAEALGFAPRVEARQVGQTDVIRVTATAGDPQSARAAARGYAAAYVDFRRAGTVDGLLASSRTVEAELGALRERIDRSAGVERAGLEQQYRFFAEVQVQLQVDAASAPSRARLVSPTREVSSLTAGSASVAAWAALVGLVLGVDLVLLFHFLDRSVKTRADLEAAAGGVPVLGEIPDSTPPAADAYRLLEALLLRARRHPSVRTVLVTSPHGGDGRTTVVANLGLALAEAGKRVTMVDADLRNPSLHDLLGVRNDVGLTSAILTPALEPVVQPVPGHSAMGVLAAGPPLRDPTEVLTSPQLATVVGHMGGGADIVLIDSPPVSAVADALVLSGLVDSILLVTLAGRTTPEDVARAVERLRSVGAPVTGLILNRASRNAGRVPARVVRS